VSAIGVAVVVVAATVACSRAPSAGFWYQDDALTFPTGVAARLGGPLTNEEMRSIERLSRAEVERAFAGLRISFIMSERAFWRVAVLRNLPTRRNTDRPRAGESLAMGFLGGSGAVGFDFVAFEAENLASPNESRQGIIEGIGRGIGRVAVHEFMHQMLGASIEDNYTDANSYEYGRPDRRSQYYGELHWTTAWPLLRRQFGNGAVALH
jgi:hypothetical protein